MNAQVQEPTIQMNMLEMDFIFNGHKIKGKKVLIILLTGTSIYDTSVE